MIVKLEFLFALTAVHIEGIVLSSVSRTGADKEYNFEVS